MKCLHNLPAIVCQVCSPAFIGLDAWVPAARPEPTGFKDHRKKFRWGLMVYDALEVVVQVLGYGAEKPGYSDNNWQRVEGGEQLYAEAMQRHLSKLMQGEIRDAESGLHHAAHIACNALFVVWFQLKRGA